MPVDRTLECLSFYRQPWNGEIITPGYDFSGKITVVHTNGNFEVWKKASGSCWNGVGCARAHSPTEYWLMEIVDYGKSAKGHNQITPGRNRNAKIELIAECDALAIKSAVP